MRPVPVEGGNSPSRILSSVDLPAPLGPKRPMRPPSRRKLTSRKACCLPYQRDIPSSSKNIMGTTQRKIRMLKPEIRNKLVIRKKEKCVEYFLISEFELPSDLHIRISDFSSYGFLCRVFGVDAN